MPKYGVRENMGRWNKENHEREKTQKCKSPKLSTMKKKSGSLIEKSNSII